MIHNEQVIQNIEITRFRYMAMQNQIPAMRQPISNNQQQLQSILMQHHQQQAQQQQRLVQGP